VIPCARTFLIRGAELSAAIGLRQDFDAATLRRLATTVKDADQLRRLTDRAVRRRRVRASEVIASDETSAREGQDALAMGVRLRTAVYHVIAPTRGKCVPTDFLAGVRPEVWLFTRVGSATFPF